MRRVWPMPCEVLCPVPQKKTKSADYGRLPRYPRNPFPTGQKGQRPALIPARANGPRWYDTEPLALGIDGLGWEGKRS